MSEQHPSSHIVESQKLAADGEVMLYALSPSTGSGSFRFKEGADATWLGNFYLGMGVSLSGNKMSSDGSVQNPRLLLGGDRADFTILKPLLFDGSIDGGIVQVTRVKLQDLIDNQNVSQDQWFRIKRVEEYQSKQITFILSSYATNIGAKLPYRQYAPPAFPFVTIN